MGITVEHISKTYGDFNALNDVSLEVREGELTALLGPSGSGKTTLLRIIAGLEKPDSGSGAIRFHHEDVADSRVQERRVGFVFQHYALFRHMTVFENVAFGLRVRPRRFRPSKPKVAERVHELLQLVQLDGMAGRFPSQLSGGQRQRVALARALAVEPRVLLLDEPFGALDASVRKQLRAWLRNLHRELQVTSVFVTHDQDEALEVADHVVIMDNGHIEQVGTPEDVFNHPATEFVMTFLGDVNVFHARVADGKVSFASLQFDAPDAGAATAARVFVRPHDLDLAREPGNAPSLPVLVTDIHAAGPTVRLRLQTPMGDQLTAIISQKRHRELGVQCGDRVHVAPRDLHVFCDPM